MNTMTMETPGFSLSRIQESKRDKFLRLANNRLENSLKDIRLIENLFGAPQTYQYDKTDVEIIVLKLNDAIERLKSYHR